jgi:hypothetical protein
VSARNNEATAMNEAQTVRPGKLPPQIAARLHLAAFRQALEKQQTSFHCGPYAIERTGRLSARDFKARVYAHGAVIATLENNGSYRLTRYGWLLVPQDSPGLPGLHEIINQLREGAFNK